MDNKQRATHLANSFWESNASFSEWVGEIRDALDAAEERGEQKEIEHQTRMARGKADYEMRAAERQEKTR